MNKLTLFKSDKPTASEIYDFYNKGLIYHTQINLDETVKVNENFYIGK